MKVALTPSFELTTKHPASSYGQPVLVNRGSGEAFGPGDILQPFPSWEFQTAAYAVHRMAEVKTLTPAESALASKFTELGGRR
jgi:hypothetical protein